MCCKITVIMICRRFKYVLCCVLFALCDASDVGIPELDSDTNTYNNSAYGDNELWSGLFNKCGKRTTFSCVERNVFGYLENTLSSDLYVTDNIYFIKNENKYSEEVNRIASERVGKSEKLDETDEQFSEFINRVESVEGLKEEEKDNKTSNIDGVTDVLYSRAVRYFVTHDLDINLPSFMMDGAKVKISPRGFDEDGGALIKFNVLPSKPEQGRFLHKIINKIFKKKLMSSFLAAMLIMKLLKIKAMFLLPVLLGVGTAKKILLKILLFLFPALAHLFKLCAYYHHHHAKYHHHHHQVAHHHHHIPVPVYSPAHHSSVGEYPAPYGYDSSGPGGPYLHSRTDSPIGETMPDLASWGIGEYPSAWDDPKITRSPETTLLKYNNYQGQQPQQQLQIQNLQYAQVQNEVKPNRVYNGNIANTNKVQAQPLYYNKGAYLQGQNVNTRVQTLTPTPPLQTPPNMDYSTYDPFYSPILQKLDSVFLQLGFTDEGCRERMVCSMYKAPKRFSPHSNLISTELSRDPSELRKPVSANSAVVRFFRYVQAARDGQELKDCLRLYAACGLATE